MCAGAIEVRHGTDELRLLGGIGRTEPVLAGAFGISALALVGVPPLSGFVAKLKLVQAAVAEHQYAAVAAVAVVSLLTLVSRSEERRVGKECVSRGRSRWAAYH